MAVSMDEIRRTADRVATSLGLDVVEVEFFGSGKHRLLRVFIEKNLETRIAKADEWRRSRPQVEEQEDAGGALSSYAAEGAGAVEQMAWITHEDCERFSRDFGPVLDVEGLIPGGEYTLEVSSPGLDRKLSDPRDFERFLGSKIKVQTAEPEAGNRHWQGRITQALPTGIILDVSENTKAKKKKGTNEVQTVELNYSNIQKANLIPEL